MSKRIYPTIGDISHEEYKKLEGRPQYDEKIGAVAIEEFRYPQKGEWFLSGAIAYAYKAPIDLSMEYHIAKLVKYKKVIRYEIVK